MPSTGQRERVTSVELSRPALVASWALGIVALAAGGAATFLSVNQAGSAALIVLGAGAVFLGLVRRMPLRLEMGGAKIDATYLQDRAFQAGHEGGLVAGFAVAERQVRETAESDGRLDSSEKRILEDLQLRRSAVDDGLDGASMEEREDEGYTGPAACRATGITYRQLDYWARTGLVVPTIKAANGRRLYSARDLVLLRVTRLLLDTGVSLLNIRRVIENLRSRSMEDLRSMTIMSDGKDVFEASSADDVIELVRDGQGVFGIAIGRVIRDIPELER